MKNQNTVTGDPLNLAALASAVAALRLAALDGTGQGREAIPALTVRLDAAHAEFAQRMELLRDRYALMKRTSAQLAEELAWLRDQLDDLSCAPEPEPPADRGDGQRRYADRWQTGGRRG